VVVGVDGSPTSEPALAMAFEEAAMRGAGLVAVHAWVEFTSETAYVSARQFLVDWNAVETREHEMLAERLAGWQEKYPDVEVRRVVTGGRPAKCLLDEADDAQLLVVGSRGRGGFTGMLLGSTSQALIHHAPCPLVVVRPIAAA
jgi:nucleotide-binding universal stress UspA family protein